MQILLDEDKKLVELNEMLVKNINSLPTNIENSIYYTKIKHLLHPEIKNFCKEQIELKEDLNFFRMSVGEFLTEKDIREYLDSLKEKYNNMQNVGIEYHIESTRLDYGVPVFCVIKRGADILLKKFVFRFRKSNIESGLGDLTNAQILKNNN